MGRISQAAKASEAEGEHADRQTPSQKAGSGRVACPTCGGKRSSEDHRRFFGLIAAAFKHWPEAHEFQPDSAEHLRAWLLCKAKHRNVALIGRGDDEAEFANAVALTVAALRQLKEYHFDVPVSSGVALVSPKSISYSDVSQKQFNAIRDDVTAIIEAELGVSADRLLKEHEGEV